MQEQQKQDDEDDDSVLSTSTPCRSRFFCQKLDPAPPEVGSAQNPLSIDDDREEEDERERQCVRIVHSNSLLGVRLSVTRKRSSSRRDGEK